MRNLQNKIQSKTHKAPDCHPQRVELDKGRVWGGRWGVSPPWYGVVLGHEKVLLALSKRFLQPLPLSAWRKGKRGTGVEKEAWELCGHQEWQTELMKLAVEKTTVSAGNVSPDDIALQSSHSTSVTLPHQRQNPLP